MAIESECKMSLACLCYTVMQGVHAVRTPQHDWQKYLIRAQSPEVHPRRGRSVVGGDGLKIPMIGLQYTACRAPQCTTGS